MRSVQPVEDQMRRRQALRSLYLWVGTVRPASAGPSPASADPALAFGLVCEYKRERKKRGKVSRKDLQHQQMVAATSTTRGDSPARFSVGRSRATSGVQSPAGPYANSNLPCGGGTVDQISRSPTEYAVANLRNNLSEVDNKLNDLGDFGAVGVVTGAPAYCAPVGAFAMTGPHTPTALSFQPFSPRSGGTACFSRRGQSNDGLGLTDLETNPEHHTATIYSEDLPCTPTDDVIHVPESCDRCDPASNSCLSAAAQVGSSHQEVRTVATSRQSLRQPAAILTGSGYNQWSPGAYSLPSPAPSAGQYPHPDETGLAFRYPALQPPTTQLDPMMSSSVPYELLDVYLAGINHVNVHPLSYTRQQPAEGAGRAVDDFLRT